MNSEERAWLAGLMEGEGCFTTTTSQTGRVNVRTALFMNDEDVVRRAQSIVGLGSVREHRAGGWWWDTSGYQAAALMLWLFPYLGQRRRSRIVEIIEPWMALDRGGHHYRDATHCKRGHEFNEVNTYVTAKGRDCRVCRKLWRERKAKTDPEWLERKRVKQRASWPKRKAQRAAKRNAA